MSLKISIGSNIVEGPWGGGNQFAISLSNYLRNKGWNVVNSLNDKDIDVILMTEPRRNLVSCKYNQLEISKYLISKPDTIVVHRINECDERKNTKNVNQYLKRANRVADYTVFISSYIKRLFIDGNILDTDNFSVIRNGADRNIFNMKNRNRWNGREVLKFVTHHWGANLNKGFDIYNLIDSYVEKEIDQYKISFSYIGNIPEGINFKNTTVIPPLSGKTLADKIKESHIYLTGSLNEPGGMHHIEGAMCGLPILYRNSGAIPEHAEGFGVMFNNQEDFFNSLKELIKKYEYYYNNMENYPYNSEFMCSEYEKLFNNLLKYKNSFDLRLRKRRYSGIYIKERFSSKKINIS